MLPQTVVVMPREKQGLWWFPTNSDEKFVGTLTFEEGHGPTLCLYIPTENGYDVLNRLETSGVICGADNSGNPITLLHPLKNETSFSNVLSSIRYSVGYAILGLEVRSRAEFLVNTLVLQLQHLHEWINRSGFIEHAFQPRGVTIRYECPARLTFTVGDLKVEVVFTCSSEDGVREKSIGENTEIRFSSANGLPLDRCGDLQDVMRRLLHFAALKPIYPVAVCARKEGLGTALGTHFIPRTIEIWSSVLREEVKPEVLPDNWVFRFDDIPDFSKFMERWLRTCKEYDEPLDCYFSTVYFESPPVIQHLRLTQALETFHAIRCQHNSQQFVTRIEELATEHVGALRGLVDDPRAFAEVVRDNRNYYTHHNPRWLKQQRVVQGMELVRLNQKLTLLFQMCILSELGIPEERHTRLRRQLFTSFVEYG